MILTDWMYYWDGRFWVIRHSLSINNIAPRVVDSFPPGVHYPPSLALS